MRVRLTAWLSCLALACVAAMPLLGADVLEAPTVVVYPIASTGGIDAAAGGNLALLIANKLTELGGLVVKPPIPGTTRAQLLDNAIAVGADYYITGFLTPIGTDSSLITQVVSTHSGSVVFSTTNVVKTYSDALADIDVVRAAVLRHAGRGLAALDAPPPAPSAKPVDSTNAGSVDIGKALRKRKREPASASASPVPADGATVATVHPERLLFAVAGDLEPARASVATRALLDAFKRTPTPAALLAVPLGDSLKSAAAICAANAGARELDAATFHTGETGGGEPRVQLDIAAYDCNGKPIASRRAVATVRGRRGIDDAIARAASEATRDLQ